MAATTHILLDTALRADALACGFERSTTTDDGGLKITFEAHEVLGPILTVNGCEGEVSFTGEAEIRELIRAAETALRRSAALAARVMEAA